MALPAELRAVGEEVGALLVRHERRTKAPDYAQYQTDILGFARTVLRVETLWEAQIEHLTAVQTGRRVAAYGANACSKTHGDAIAALWWVYAWGGLVIATSAKEQQLRDQFMRVVASLFRRAPALDGELFTLAFRRPDLPDSGILCMAAGDASRLRGYHAPLVFCQLHEAQGLPDWAFASVETMATGAEDRVTATGNSNVADGPFYQRCHSSTWTAVRFDASKHPNIISGDIVIPGGPTRESLAQRKSDFGAGSPFYRSSVLGEFLTDSDAALIEHGWVQQSAARWAATQPQAAA